MIIAGEPTKGLQKHQQDAYKAVKEGFEKDNKAAVVIPTGCGKSFISFQLMADNKDKQIVNIRRENPEANLQEIAEIYTEKYGSKISKSGVNHRLRKIKEIANNIED